MAISGEAVRQYFEDKLQEIFPGQNFPETPEAADQASESKEKDDDDETEDSDDDFVQPKRKRLKTEEKIVHIKWQQASSWNKKERIVFRVSQASSPRFETTI